MQERLNQYRPILAVLIVACGLMAAVTSRYDMPLFYICLGAWALLSLGCIIWMTVITRQNRRRFGRLKDSLEHIMSDAVLSLPMPSLIVRESGEVVWSNPPAKQGVFPGQELFGHNIAELVPGLDWQAESSGLTGAGLGLCDDIVCFFVVEQNGDREFLDRRRGFEAFRFNGFEGDVGQSERSEFF